MFVLEYVLLGLFSYFLGNISWARIISKKNHGDITKSGSGNPGTMNMLRTYGAGVAFLTLGLDVLKGTGIPCRKSKQRKGKEEKERKSTRKGSPRA